MSTRSDTKLTDDEVVSAAARSRERLLLVGIRAKTGLAVGDVNGDCRFKMKRGASVRNE